MEENQKESGKGSKLLAVGAWIVLAVVCFLYFYRSGDHQSDGDTSPVDAKAMPVELGLSFGGGWYDLESRNEDYWRWARSPAVVTFNAVSKFENAFLRAKMRGEFEQTVQVLLNGEPIRELKLNADAFVNVGLAMRLKSGENQLEFVSDKPSRITGGDSRELGFLLQDYAWYAEAPVSLSYVPDYGSGWYSEESFEELTWRWTKGQGDYEITNFLDKPQTMRLKYRLRTIEARTVVVEQDGKRLDAVSLAKAGDEERELEVTLEPGYNRIQFLSNEPATKVDGDSRDLSFCLYLPVIEKI